MASNKKDNSSWHLITHVDLANVVLKVCPQHTTPFARLLLTGQAASLIVQAAPISIPICAQLVMQACPHVLLLGVLPATFQCWPEASEDAMQDVGRLVMLGAELGQMPAWYVELSYALALEQCALLHQQPKSPALAALEAGMAPPCAFQRPPFSSP